MASNEKFIPVPMPVPRALRESLKGKKGKYFKRPIPDTMTEILKSHYNEGRGAVFSELMMKMFAQMDLDVSARGWAYILVQARAISQDQIDKAIHWMNKGRKKGQIPVDILGGDLVREFHDVTPVEDFTGRVYIQMLVNHSDLLPLFRPVTQSYGIPIAYARGWSSITQRAELARRFKEAEMRGKSCVLLYCGDHDPEGMRIADRLKKCLYDVRNVVWRDGFQGYHPGQLVVDRFGLDEDFIERHKFPWIYDLRTASGKDVGRYTHPNRKHDYVSRYISQFGRKRCESNVLVTEIETSRQLCRDAIEKYK